MAVLGEIRRHSWLLIIVIGVAMAAFLIGDLFRGGGSGLFGNPNKIGSVADVPITIQEYNNTFNRVSNNPNLQDANANIRSEYAWNQLIAERVIQDRMDDLGLTFSENEYWQQAGRFYASVNPSLVDENQRVNIEATKQFYAQLKQAAQTGDKQAIYFLDQWDNANPQFNLLRTQYLNLIANGALSTDLDASYNANANSETADFDYVLINYDQYATSNKIEVSDTQIESYLKEHTTRFKPASSVDLSYAYFPGSASTTDVNRIKGELESYKTEQVLEDTSTGVSETVESFANATNDSIFVSRFSNFGYDPTYYSKEQIEQLQNETLKSALLNGSKGDVIGPLKVNNTYQLNKISDIKSITDSAKTSHILIAYQGSTGGSEAVTRTREEAKEEADRLLSEIKANPSKFNEYARTKSDDAVAAEDAGKLPWIGRFQQNFAQSYRDFAVTNPKGSIDVVESQFGFHIIRIDDVKQVTGYKIASIIKPLEPSEETQNKLFDDANQIAIDSKGIAANEFLNRAKEKGAEVNSASGVKRFDSSLSGLSGTNKETDILAWAFNKDTQAGTVKTFNTDNGGQIVAYLNKRLSKDQYNIEAYRSEVEPLVRQDLIAEAIAKEANGLKDLSAIAKKYNTEVKNANINYARPIIEGSGVEPSVAGAVFGLKEGMVSEAIKGNTGVFFVKPTKQNKPVAKDDYSNERKQVDAQNKQVIQSQLMQSLIDAAEVEDNRESVLK